MAGKAMVRHRKVSDYDKIDTKSDEKRFFLGKAAQ
jgi:hypothetical protein